MSQINIYEPTIFLKEWQMMKYKFVWRYMQKTYRGIKLPYKMLVNAGTVTHTERMTKWLQYWYNVWFINVTISKNRTQHVYALKILHSVEWYLENTPELFPAYDDEYKIWKTYEWCAY
jgi:hypothetical protein